MDLLTPTCALTGAGIEPAGQLRGLDWEWKPRFSHVAADTVTTE